MKLSLGFLALTLSTVVACSAETPDDASVSSDLRTPSAFQKIVERKGNVFNVFCRAPETNAVVIRVRAFFQPDLYPQGQIDWTDAQDAYPHDPAFPGQDIIPRDTPEFFAVSNRFSGTEIVFTRTDDGMAGEGTLRGTPGRWTCEVWAKRYLESEDAWSAWRRAL